MFERFDADARDVFDGAREAAARLRHAYLGKEHLLLAMAGQRTGIAGEVLRGLGVSPETVEREILRIVGRGDPPRLTSEDEDALKALGIDLQEVRRTIEAAFGPGALDRGTAACGEPFVLGFPLTPRAKQALQLALREATALGDGSIRSEHVLLGLVRSQGGVGAEVLSRLALDPRVIRVRVLERLTRAS